MPSLFSLIPSDRVKRTSFIYERRIDGRVDAKELLIMDATITQSHVTEAVPTQEPVETGADITDHVDVRPRTFRLEAVVSDAPIRFVDAIVGNIAGAVGSLFGGLARTVVTAGAAVLGGALLNRTGNRTRDAYNTLLEIQGLKQVQGTGQIIRGTPLPIKVITSLTVYENMILTNVNVNRDASTGNEIRFTAELKEIRIVQSEEIKLPKEVIDQGIANAASGAVNRGKQATKEATEAEKEKFDLKKGSSLLLKLAKAAVS